MKKKGIGIAFSAILLMTACLIANPTSGQAVETQGCSNLGSWYGYNPPPDNTLLWITNVIGQSHSTGIINLEAPGYDPKFGGLFPTAVKVSTLRGEWVRTSGNTFDVTMIGFSIDDTGHTVGIGKMSGKATLVDDCNTEIIEVKFEFFGPTDDPFSDEPFYGFDIPAHYGYRMSVDAQ